MPTILEHIPFLIAPSPIAVEGTSPAPIATGVPTSKPVCLDAFLVT